MDDLERISIEKQQTGDSQGDGTLETPELPLKTAMASSRTTALVPIAMIPDPHSTMSVAKSFCGKGLAFWVLMLLSTLASLVGLASATLLGRLYFVHGGSRRWLYTWIQSAGWPVLLLPLLLSYLRQPLRPSPPTLKLLAIYSLMGCVSAFDNLLYSWGLSFLPVSTNALICSSQLAFNVVFSFLLVRQKITPYVLNAVVVITTSTVLLGVHSSSDRPPGTTQRQYVLGFVVTIAASALYALLLTLMEVIYRRVIGKSSFLLVLEMQTGISIAATAFSMVGMWVDGSFAGMREEALRFDLGPTVYAMTLLWSAIGWQIAFLGTLGIIFLSSALMSCVFQTALTPLLPLLAVTFFHDSFTALKAISMVLAIWGFISYIYGGYADSKTRSKNEESLSCDLEQK